MHWMSRLATVLTASSRMLFLAGNRHDDAHSMAVAPARHLQMSAGTLPFLLLSSERPHGRKKLYSHENGAN